MSKCNYRRMIHKDDPRTGLMIPKELYEDLMVAAQANGRKLSQELIARLATSLEEPEMMSHDRLMRLIFCSKLAYKGNTHNRRLG